MPIISQSTDALTSAVPCLFGFLRDSLCTYQTANLPVYFSLGEAVAAFGLIFAVFQLTKPAWEITLKIRPSWQRLLLFISSGIGLFCIFLSVLVSQIPTYWFPNLHLHPSFFETLGFVAFVIGPTSYFIFATNRSGLFHRNSAARFYGVLLGETARATPERIEAIVNLIGANLDEICAAASEARTWYSRASTNPPLSEKELTGEYAKYVFEVILGDDTIANYIATARLDFLVSLFQHIKKHNLSRAHLERGISKLFRCLFDNPSSLLYRHLDRTGLSLSANLYQIIFEDTELTNGLDPFSDWNTWSIHRQARDEKHLTVFLTALEHAVEGYLKEPRTIYSAKGVTQGFRKLQNFIEHRSYESEEQQDKLLHELSFFLGHIFPWAFRKAAEKSLVGQDDLTGKHDDPFELSLSVEYAKTVFKFMEMLAVLSVQEGAKEDSIRVHSMSATDHLIGYQANEGDALDGGRKFFLKKLWEQIEVNGKGGYPAVVRVYIALLGWGAGAGTTVMGQERNRLIEFLKTVIAPKLLVNARMGNGKDVMEEELLPKDVTFNRATGKFEYASSVGTPKVIE